MINKRFLNFKTYAEFSRLNESGEIRPESIVWIADTNQMWTHGTLYSSITEEQASKLAGILTNGAGLKYLTDKLTYEELPDQATVIDIDGKIMDLTTESSNEDILAVFGTLPDFISLIEIVRNSETILNSILVNNNSQVGKVNATILANKISNILDIIYFDHIKKTFVQLTITETEGVLSCTREEFGSAGGGDTTPEVAITEAEPVPGSQEKVYYQVVEDNADLGVDKDAPADGNMYGRKDNVWEKIESWSDNVYVFDYKNVTIENTAELKTAINAGKSIVIDNNPNYYYATRATSQLGNIYLTWQSIAEENVTIYNNSTPVTMKQSTVTSYFLTIKESDASKVLTSNKTGISSGGASLSDALGAGYTVASSGYASKKYSRFMFFANADLGESTPVVFDGVNVFRTTGDTVYKRVMPDKNGKLYEFSFIITNGESAKITAREIPSGSVDLSNYLAKDNSTEFTPSADYNPATKKYVDDKKIEYINFTNFNFKVGKEENISFNYNIGQGISLDNIKNGSSIRAKIELESPINPDVTITLYVKGSLDYNNVYIDDVYTDNLIFSRSKFITISITYNIITSKLSYNIKVIPNQCILTKSEYAALGSTTNTDNVLYFVTPDA
jgi:hypothetical protein|nr:MAG TPA: hypothetical protein [Caudoviricetes sp.]